MHSTYRCTNAHSFISQDTLRIVPIWHYTGRWDKRNGQSFLQRQRRGSIPPFIAMPCHMSQTVAGRVYRLPEDQFFAKWFLAPTYTIPIFRSSDEILWLSILSGSLNTEFYGKFKNWQKSDRGPSILSTYSYQHKNLGFDPSSLMYLNFNPFLSNFEFHIIN